MIIPRSLREEHAHIIEVMESASREGGTIGPAATAVLAVLRPHLEKEEQIALPPLGMLTLSSEGTAQEVEETIALSQRFSDDLSRMLEEHVIIGEKLQVLSVEAENAARKEYATIARELDRHMRLEEEIIYPAALLIGSYLRLWQARKVKA
ncbi:MAG: hypothetical protein SA339_09970 [Methanomassiliicoccus sp.]|nr:hypothetical protein [Methanomassiliicoccus sp.]